MPRFRYLSFFVFIFVLLVGGLFLFKEGFFLSPNNVSESVDPAVAEGVEVNESVPGFSYICQAGRNVYEELQINGKIDSTDSSFGPMVTGINGQSQGEGKYWLYSVDGAEATVGASAYLCKGGEQITWELK